MSPTIFMVPAMQPSQLFGRGCGVGGITSATGSPKRVTRMGLRVLRTSSKRPRHLALNSEIATSFILFHLYHGQRLWSILGLTQQKNAAQDVAETGKGTT